MTLNTLPDGASDVRTDVELRKLAHQLRDSASSQTWESKVMPTINQLSTEDLIRLAAQCYGRDEIMVSVRHAIGATIHHRFTRQTADHMTTLSTSMEALIARIDDSGKKATKAAYVLATVGLLVAVVDVLVAVGFLPRVGPQ